VIDAFERDDFVKVKAWFRSSQPSQMTSITAPDGRQRNRFQRLFSSSRRDPDEMWASFPHCRGVANPI